MASMIAKCSVCLTSLEECNLGSQLSCSHDMCQPCIKSLSIEKSVLCPLCWKTSFLKTDSKGQEQTTSTDNSLNSSTIEANLETIHSKFPEITIGIVKNDQNRNEKTNVPAGSVNETKPAVKNPLKDMISKKRISDQDIRSIVNKTRRGHTKVITIVEELLELPPHEGVPMSCRSLFSWKITPKFSHRKEPAASYDGMIVSSKDPYNVYIQILDDELKRWCLLNEELQSEFRSSVIKSEEEVIDRIEPGDACAVSFHDAWYRAVLEHTNKVTRKRKLYKVMCSDTGRHIIVNSCQIRPLPMRFTELPAQAVLCKLKCVPPLELKVAKQLRSTREMVQVNYSWWPTDVANVIRQKEKAIVRVFVEHFDADRFEYREAVLLTTMHVQGEAKSVNQQVDDALDKVLMKGSCHPYNTLLSNACSDVLMKPLRNTKTYENFSRTIDNASKSGSVHVEDNKFSTVSQSSNPSSIRNFDSSSTCSTRVGRSIPEIKTKQVDLWDFPEPNTSLISCFRGIVTWVDNDGKFFLHDSKWLKQLLVIRDKLNTTFNKTKPSMYDLRCQPGDACAAKFIGNWYRGIVMSVSERKSNVNVFFIDYGVVRIVYCCDIRRDVILTEVPVQTFRCTLHNVKPIQGNRSDANWSDDVISFIHDVAVKKEFNVSVQTYSPLKVSLQFPKNSVDLSDVLVASGRADYIVKP